MNSATSTNVGSTTVSHATDTTAKHGYDVKGGNNSKDSDSEGEGAEEVCLKKFYILRNLIL
uniref:Bm8370 n=1 Tax=Brugia malayi TaxID=6279 RepID=A0A1I9GCM6_BRUMA|nr:Bm8370 [Brugia malayi]